MKVKCFICKKEVWRASTRVYKYNFCSYACRNKHYSNEKSFVWRGGAEAYSKRQRDRKVDFLQRIKKKQRAVNFMGGKCSKCGYNKCIAALEFHHKDPKTKERGIKELCVGSWNKVEKELKKCVLVCSNCHREIHWDSRKEKRDTILRLQKELEEQRLNREKKYHGRSIRQKAGGDISKSI